MVGRCLDQVNVSSQCIGSDRHAGLSLRVLPFPPDFALPEIDCDRLLPGVERRYEVARVPETHDPEWRRFIDRGGCIGIDVERIVGHGPYSPTGPARRG